MGCQDLIEEKVFMSGRRSSSQPIVKGKDLKPLKALRSNHIAFFCDRCGNFGFGLKQHWPLRGLCGGCHESIIAEYLRDKR